MQLMQRVQLVSSVVLLGGMLTATGVCGQEVSAFPSHDPIVGPRPSGSAFMRVFGAAQPPHGFVRFCEAMPQECKSDHRQEARFNASPERLKQLDEINRAVNHAIAPATDMEVYGVPEYWTLPRTRGDCEDYALLKRHDLIRKGWPVSAMLMTVVRDERGEGHAVLTARTVQGDFILDNKTDEVRLWNKTPYEYVMRQSYINPRVWVALDTRQNPLATALSGLEHNP
jgi:predicted transglutaminase-like cysteine proteinase